MTRIEVRAEHTYSVHVGRSLLDEIFGYVSGASRVAVIHPESMRHVAGLIRLQLKDFETIAIEVPDAESAKSVSVLEFCWMALGNAGFTRNDLIISVGGGATTDLAGFVAATWLRGIQVLHIPTTLLAMVDAAVGGKTGINTSSGKNLVGAIYSPVAVLCDMNFLDTQAPADYAAGLSEVIKCGFIRDQQILELIENNPEDAINPHWDSAEELISRAIQVKADVVGADLRETLGTSGGREILNYGHTFGHAIERNENYTWRHGDAVAVGMMFVANLAHLAGRLDSDCVSRHTNILSLVGLPTTYNRATFAQLHDVMRIDKKARGDKLRFIVLDAVAKPGILEDPDTALLMAAYNKLGQGNYHA